MGTCRPAILRVLPAVLILLSINVLASGRPPGASHAFSAPAGSPAANAPRVLTFADRVAAQEAIERVYYAHQIGATRPFEEAVPRAVIVEKVRTYLKKTVALEKMWNTKITGEMLRAEVERMVRETRIPERLREIFAALHDDPVLVEECLARPILVNRLARERFAVDRSLHESARLEAEDLRMELKSGRLGVTEAEDHRTVIEFVRKQTEAAKYESMSGGPAATPDAAGEASAVSPVETVESSPEEFATRRGMAPARAGEVGEIVEESDAFVIRSVLEERADRFREATYRFPKVSWDAWWIGEKDRFDENGVEAVSVEDSPLPNPVGDSVSPSTICQPDNTWMTGIPKVQPLPQLPYGPAVWTGSLMIAWSGLYNGRYDPTTDTFTPVSTTNAPRDRFGHSAVWTGTRMIVWGGDESGDVYPFLNTGGLYDPIADSWQPTVTAGAPVGRRFHTAVWTGSRMLIYGGQLCQGTPGNPCTLRLSANDGGSYTPQGDAWTPLPPAGTLCGGRYNHAAIWTGSEMAIWGGVCESASCDCAAPSNEGARYNPGTNLWTPMSTVNAPAGRDYPGAVWTGSRMLIWGGGSGPGPAVPGGGSYDPAGDSWSPISTVNAPPAAVKSSVVWTGSTMIAWGGQSSGTNPDYYNEGGRYDPASDTWSPTSTVGAPTPRSGHPAVWTGSLMVIMGDYYADSAGTTHGRYDPLSDTWMPEPELVIGRAFHTAVWTGSEMIVWGGFSGNGGDRYDPATDSWSSISLVDAPSRRGYHTAVWTGTEMIVWGGDGNTGRLDSGGRYNPATDSWTPTSLIGAPSPRYLHTAVWTGTEMIIWGGENTSSTRFDSGGRYDPVTDMWVPTQLTGAPQPRSSHTAVWTGSRMIVWGGAGNSGGLYDPVADAWTPTSTTNAPSARSSHGAVWTGSRMVVWGGSGGGTTGGRYDPVGNTWTSTSQVNAPQARRDFTAVWADFVMVVWGGIVSTIPLPTPTNNGGRYNPVSDTWTSTPTQGAPVPRYVHTAVWTGEQMIVWGGRPYSGPYLNDGGALNVNTTSVDGDGDSYVACAGDCNDADPNVHPGATEMCNAIDDDCNGTVDAIATACGLGPCHSTGSCVMGEDSCIPGPSSPEACNGVDDDCDGFVPSNEIDGDGDGVRICQNDCDDSRSDLWATPGEVVAVTFTGPTTMTWQSPVSPGASSIVYDVIRSSSKSNFTTGASCPYTNGTNTSFLPNAVPSLGQAYYFLVRAEDGCPQGSGPVGDQSNGTPRTARTCP